MTTRDAGILAERAAEQYLSNKGFKLVCRNYRAKVGEIDLIMVKSDLLIFVEVRLRTNRQYGTGAETVTWQKQRKIIKTAQSFLQSHDDKRWQSYRFDVISINDISKDTLAMEEKLDWIPDAFTLDYS